MKLVEADPRVTSIMNNIGACLEDTTNKMVRLSVLKDVKDEVERMIQEDIDANRRAEAREIRNKLRDLKNPDEPYRFLLKNCLNESQIKSQITRVLNKNKKGDQLRKGSEGGEVDVTPVT